MQLYRSRKAEMMAQEKRSEDGMKTIRKGDQKGGERWMRGEGLYKSYCVEENQRYDGRGNQVAITQRAYKTNKKQNCNSE